MIYAAHSMAIVLLLSALLGMFFGLVFDAMRFARELITMKMIGKYARIFSAFSFLLTFVFDLFFFSFCGMALSIFLFYTNDGIFRLSSVALTIIGFCIYRMTLGKFIYALLKFVEKIFKKIVIFSVKAIAFPIKSVYNILVKVSERISGTKSGSCQK